MADQATARLAQTYVGAHTKKGTPIPALHEFSPYIDEPEITLDKAMEQWK
jgi:hypothetical protein